MPPNLISISPQVIWLHLTWFLVIYDVLIMVISRLGGMTKGMLRVELYKKASQAKEKA